MELGRETVFWESWWSEPDLGQLEHPLSEIETCLIWESARPDVSQMFCNGPLRFFLTEKSKDIAKATRLNLAQDCWTLYYNVKQTDSCALISWLEAFHQQHMSRRQSSGNSAGNRWMHLQLCLKPGEAWPLPLGLLPLLMERSYLQLQGLLSTKCLCPMLYNCLF